MRRPWVPAVRVLAVLAAVMVVVPPAQAFVSVEKGGSPHDEITGVAADLGWPEDAVEALQDAVRLADISDFDEEEVDGERRLVVTPVHAPEHHCTREPPATDAEAFNATVAYIAWERSVAENLTLLDPWAGMRALGRALHALQDCHSHSNLVDLDATAHGRMRDSLLHGGPMPEGLALCGSQPGIAEIGRPPGDPYPHDDHNKDSPDASPESEELLADGRTKYEAARDLAAKATAAFLTDFMAGLDADASARLLEVDDEELDNDEDEDGTFGIPAPGTGLLVLPLLALAALLARRRA